MESQAGSIEEMLVSEQETPKISSAAEKRAAEPRKESLEATNTARERIVERLEPQAESRVETPKTSKKAQKKSGECLEQQAGPSGINIKNKGQKKSGECLEQQAGSSGINIKNKGQKKTKEQQKKKGML
jgi:hypothetical protein